jgi:competence protein ComEA
MKQNRNFEKHLYLPKGERNGVILFFLISIICLFLFKKLSQENYKLMLKSSSTLSAKSTINIVDKKLDKKFNTFKNVPKKLLKKVHQKFYFNPNNTNKDSLLALGFSKKVIGNIMKYKEKGGIITSFNQLKRIYNIDTNLLNELRPYIQFTNNTVEHEIKNISRANVTFENKYKEVAEEIPSNKIELNSADSAQLVTIKGIGPYYAKKILKMRKIMGGFSDVDQLSECKILPDSVYQKIKSQITADSEKMDKININTAGFRSLIQHPYFDENLVKVLLNYRQNHGNFSSLTQLKRIRVLTQEKYEKIVRHLRI